MEEISDYPPAAEEMKRIQYQWLEDALKKKQWTKALEYTNLLGDYKEAPMKLEQAWQGLQDQLKTAQIGDTVYLGDYNEENLFWEVAEKEEHKLLLVRKDVVDWKPYHDKVGEVTWENCSLRVWLNEDFYEQAFPERVKPWIAQVTLPNTSSHSDVDGGNNTQDRIFLLSEQELDKYYYRIEVFFINTGIFKSAKDGVRYLAWLRSPGANQKEAEGMILTVDWGEILDLCDGFEKSYPLESKRVTQKGLVIPAMWIDLDAIP